MVGQREPRSASPIAPRLFTAEQAGEYLGLSAWTIRDYVAAGILPAVDLPPLRAREGARPKRRLRRLLIDRADLDALIERSRGAQ